MSDVNMNEESNPKIPRDSGLERSLRKEADSELHVVAKEFYDLLVLIDNGEKQLAAWREKKAALLRENPWLGNSYGILRKRSEKMVEEALAPPEEENPEAAQFEQPEVEDSSMEVKGPPDPLDAKLSKKKAAAADLAAKASRKNISKTVNRLNAEKQKSLSQFPSGHPAREQ